MVNLVLLWLLSGTAFGVTLGIIKIPPDVILVNLEYIPDLYMCQDPHLLLVQFL